MRPYRTDAIVLHSFPSRERDKLVVLLTPDRGKLRGWAYGSRSLKSRYGAALEPLSRIRIVFVEKEGDETVRLESAELVRSLFAAQQDLRASVAGSYIAEMADVFAPPHEAAELLFRLLDRSSQALLDGLSPVTVVAYFEVWVLKLGGIFPSLDHCAECHADLAPPYRFDVARSGFVCPACTLGSSELISNEVIADLGALSRLSIEAWAAKPRSAETLFDMRMVARRVRRHFLGHELKSHDILQSVL